MRGGHFYNAQVITRSAPDAKLNFISSFSARRVSFRAIAISTVMSEACSAPEIKNLTRKAQ